MEERAREWLEVSTFRKANDLLSDERRERLFKEREKMTIEGGKNCNTKTDIYILSR